MLLTEEGIRPIFCPDAWNWAAITHEAVNVRTYVRPSGGGPPGIYFLTLDATSAIATLGAFALFRLPYRFARIVRTRRRTDEGVVHHRFTAQRVRFLWWRTSLPSLDLEVKVRASGMGWTGASSRNRIPRFLLLEESHWHVGG